MKQQDFLRLRKEIVERARVVPRPTRYQIEVEKLQARKLAALIQLRLSQLQLKPRHIARELDIELEFVMALLNATFPVSQLSPTMLEDLASSLRLEAADLRQTMEIDD